MDRKLELEIIEKYPKLYGTKKEHKYIGFMCDNGWYEIIDELSAKLEKILTRLENRGVDISEFKPLQVKEKFGELRFYMSLTTRDMLDAIEETESKSRKICEVCGKPGRLRTDRAWIRTLCDKHA